MPELRNGLRMVLANGHEIGESLRDTYRTWGEYIELLKKARKFKEWLVKQEPDAILIHEYLKALEKDTWLNSTPAKTIRFIVLQVLGFLVPGAANVTLNAADSLLLERLMRGWRPSQFVNGPLKRDFAGQD